MTPAPLEKTRGVHPNTLHQIHHCSGKMRKIGKGCICDGESLELRKTKKNTVTERGESMRKILPKRQIDR